MPPIVCSRLFVWPSTIWPCTKCDRNIFSFCSIWQFQYRRATQTLLKEDEKKHWARLVEKGGLQRKAKQLSSTVRVRGSHTIDWDKHLRSYWQRNKTEKLWRKEQQLSETVSLGNTQKARWCTPSGLQVQEKQQNLSLLNSEWEGTPQGPILQQRLLLCQRHPLFTYRSTLHDIFLHLRCFFCPDCQIVYACISEHECGVAKKTLSLC